jgi:predicted transcriptional regulator
MKTQPSKRSRVAAVPPPLHELESEVMEQLWAGGEASVRSVMEALNSAGKERAYTTYMTIMARLDSKGLLERRREGKTDFYRPVYTRDRYTDLRALLAIESVVDQFGEVALAHIARQMAQLDPEHRRSLQRLARKP